MAQAPRFLQDLVGQVFREHHRTEHVTLATLQKHWAALVGPGVAERTWPSRLQQGVLWITAPDSSWAYQLQFLKTELLSGIRAGLPAFRLNDLRFRVGEMPAQELLPGQSTPAEVVSTAQVEVPGVELAGTKRRAMPTVPQTTQPSRAPARSPEAKATAQTTVSTPPVEAAPEPPPASPELARAAESIADPTLRAAFLRALAKQAKRGTEKP